MPIARKPTATSGVSAPVDEKHIEQFISGVAKSDVTATASDRRKKPTPIRFDPDMYERIDKAARRRGQSRAAWVRYVVSQALEVEEDR